MRADRDGTLEGVEIVVNSAPPGAVLGLRVIKGPGWNTGTPLYTGSQMINVIGAAPVGVLYFDVSAAGIQLTQGEVYVLEMQSINQGTSTLNYGMAKFGTIYPEPFFFNGVVFPGGTTLWSATFRTWMDGGTGVRYCSAAPNSHSSVGARLSVHGSTSIAAGDLKFYAASAPNNLGLYFYGPNQVLLPFGDGVRCVGGALTRMQALVGSQFLLPFDLDYASPDALKLVPGSTWNFQAWYRDPAAMASGFNLSEGVQLTLVP